MGFLRIERHIPSVSPVSDFCQGLRREKRLLPICQRMSDVMVESGVINRDQEDFPESVRSLMNIRNNLGLRALPWGSPALTGRGDERVSLRATC